MSMKDVPNIAKDFSRLVDEILCFIWDPLQMSVEFFPNTRSEYSMYVGRVCSAVASGATEDEITEILNTIVIKEMKQDSMRDKCAEVSALIFKSYKFLLDEPGMGHNILTNYKKYCEAFYLAKKVEPSNSTNDGIV